MNSLFVFLVLLIFNSQQQQKLESSSVHEDLSSILFLLLFHEISSLDKLNEDLGLMSTTLKTKKHFCVNSIILKYFTQTFEIGEFKRQLIDKNLKFNSIFKSLDNNLKEILSQKFRIYWNIKWHGGSIEQLIEDLLFNTRIQNDSKLHIEYECESINKFIKSSFLFHRFSDYLVLTEKDKQIIKSTNPLYLFKQLFSAISTSTTHNDALIR